MQSFYLIKFWKIELRQKMILSLDGIDLDVVEAGKSTKSRSTNQAILGDWSWGGA